MSIIKYNPRRLRTQGVNNLLDELFNDSFFDNSVSETSFTPQVDVAETEKAFELQFSVPGLKKEDLNIELNSGVLTVSGERKFKDEKKEKNYHSVETKYGAFKRSFELPDSIDQDAVDAKYEDGILNILVPKDAKKIEKKNIIIN